MIRISHYSISSFFFCKIQWLKYEELAMHDPNLQVLPPPSPAGHSWEMKKKKQEDYSKKMRRKKPVWQGGGTDGLHY